MIYGIGARYGAQGWMVEDFHNAGVACVGYGISQCPEIHAQMREIGMGDIIYLKAFGASSSSICVMGVGLVVDNDVVRVSQNLGYGVKVEWVYTNEYQIPAKLKLGFDKHRNVRVGTLYKEFNRDIQTLIIDMMVNPSKY